MSVLDAAIEYRDRGWCPVPVVPRENRPSDSDWLNFDPTNHRRRGEPALKATASETSLLPHNTATRVDRPRWNRACT